MANLSVAAGVQKRAISDICISMWSNNKAKVNLLQMKVKVGPNYSL